MRLQGRNVRVGRSLLPILLDARRAQARKAMAVDRILPGQKLLNGEGVTAAGFFERQQAAAHGGHHFSLAADHPTLRPRCRQIRYRQRTPVGSDHVFCPRTMGLGHGYSHTQTDNEPGGDYVAQLKIWLSRGFKKGMKESSAPRWRLGRRSARKPGSSIGAADRLDNLARRVGLAIDRQSRRTLADINASDHTLHLR